MADETRVTQVNPILEISLATHARNTMILPMIELLVLPIASVITENLVLLEVELPRAGVSPYGPRAQATGG